MIATVTWKERLRDGGGGEEVGRLVMEGVAEGLWALADGQEKRGDLGQAIKCLEAVCQCQPCFLPLTEVKSRVRVAALLLQHTENVCQARNHLERALLLLKQIPSCFQLKCQALSLLSRCYCLTGAVGPQKQALRKGLDLAGAEEGVAALRWACNFSLQMAAANAGEGEFGAALQALEWGLHAAAAGRQAELGMVFATSIVHVRLMNCHDGAAVEQGLGACEAIWFGLPAEKKVGNAWLWRYKELLHVFHLIRMCEYKDATGRVCELDAGAAQQGSSRRGGDGGQRLGLGFVEEEGAVGEWLPKEMVRALVDLMQVVCERPKGQFAECMKQIEAGVVIANEELGKLGIGNEDVTERDVQHGCVYIAGVGVTIWMQLVENKVIVDLTRGHFPEAQQALISLLHFWSRFPTLLQPCEVTLHLLLGHYAHAVGCPKDAAQHFVKASKMDSRLQAVCHVYAALCLSCTGDPEHCSQALDLLGPVFQAMDSYVGVREKTLVLLVSAILQMKEDNGQEARSRLATGLKLTYEHLGNNQLVSQYLKVLGSIALSMHDLYGAERILSSSLTLATALFDLPTQIAIMDEFNALYQELGDSVRQQDNMLAQERARQDFMRRIAIATSSQYHHYLLRHRLDSTS